MKLCPKCSKQFSDDANFCPVCAARLQPISGGGSGADGLATRFEMGAPLGGGRTGHVHKATDKQNGDKTVAVKLIAPAVLALPGVAQRLERELKQLERVSSVGVTKVIASGKRGEDWWVAAELLDGAQTLAAAIHERGPLAIPDAAALVEVVGEALIEAAQVGVVHRDLAPKNVLFAGQDVKLINFSLPVPSGEKTPGVPEFVAPEQLDGKPVDQRSNLYSLGALYYYVLTGKTVVTGTSAAEIHAAHANAAIKPPSQLAANIPSVLDALILRALDRSPTKRFLTVRQFVDEVARVREHGGGDVKSTLPMGKAGSASAGKKSELVQTLLGVRLQPSQAAIPLAAAAGGAPIASAPTVGGVSALAPSVLAPPAAATAPAAAAASVATDATAPAPIVPAPAVPVPAPNAAPPLSTTVVGLSGGVMVAPAPATAAAPAPSPEAAPSPAPAATPATTPAERSPWSPPAGETAIPAPAAPVVAAAAAAAPAPAAPVLAKPVVAKKADAAPAGKKKPADEDKKSKGKFRETMWFKKGELDAQAAQAAAQERARTGKDVSGDKADSLPMDERYKDDGSLSRGDAEKYSLRTGGTQMMAKIREGGGTGGDHHVSDDALIGEMKTGRNTIIIVLISALVVLGVVVFAFTR